MACCTPEYPESGCCCDQPARSCDGPVLPEIPQPPVPTGWDSTDCCGGGGTGGPITVVVEPVINVEPPDITVEVPDIIVEIPEISGGLLGPGTCVLTAEGETVYAYPSPDGWYVITPFGLGIIETGVTILDPCDPRCAPDVCIPTCEPVVCCATDCPEGAVLDLYIQNHACINAGDCDPAVLAELFANA